MNKRFLKPVLLVAGIIAVSFLALVIAHFLNASGVPFLNSVFPKRVVYTEDMLPMSHVEYLEWRDEIYASRAIRFNYGDPEKFKQDNLRMCSSGPYWPVMWQVHPGQEIEMRIVAHMADDGGWAGACPPAYYKISVYSDATNYEIYDVIPSSVSPTVTVTPTSTPGVPTVTATETIRPTITPETPPSTVLARVNVYGDNIDEYRGLNIRCQPSLYNDCNVGYLLPYCNYVEEGRYCSSIENAVPLYETIKVATSLFFLQDRGWWGRVHPTEDWWIALCLERDAEKAQPCYTDWRPPE